jgi:hypothetical protein
VDVDQIIDRLYGLPAAEFTRARDEAARELRREGHKEDAEHVKTLRKPTAAAAAVNRLVRENRDEVEQFLRAAERLRDAQFAGEGDFGAATRQQREALERLIGAGGEAVRQTLLAAAVDDAAATQLLDARLERELEPRGFGTLLAHARPAAPKPTRQRPAAKPNDGAARARLQDAKRALSAATAEEQHARRRWEQAGETRKQAQQAVEDAQRDLDRLHGR